MPRTPPPLKSAFQKCREREFLYLHEIDAVVAAMEFTRYPARNKALAMLLFCQALQPSELCWLRWCDIDFAEKILAVKRNRQQPNPDSSQITLNLQPLSQPEISILQELQEQRCTDWLFASERKQRLSERSLHYIIQLSGTLAALPMSVHPYMLRRTGLYYRAALLLQPIGLSLRQCCLLWNWYGTGIVFSAKEEQEYCAIDRFREEAFLLVLERMKAFTGISTAQNIIDYLLGAYLLFPQLQGIPHDYWLTPRIWQEHKLCRKDLGKMQLDYSYYDSSELCRKHLR